MYPRITVTFCKTMRFWWGGGDPKIDFEVWKYTQITDTVSFKILATLEQINVTLANI